jgi:hypothetical protein
VKIPVTVVEKNDDPLRQPSGFLKHRGRPYVVRLASPLRRNTSPASTAGRSTVPGAQNGCGGIGLGAGGSSLRNRSKGLALEQTFLVAIRKFPQIAGGGGQTAMAERRAVPPSPPPETVCRPTWFVYEDVTKTFVSAPLATVRNAYLCRAWAPWASFCLASFALTSLINREQNTRDLSEEQFPARKCSTP